MSTQTLKSNNEKIFLDFNRVLSFNAFLSIIIGERGVGKTYGAKKYVVKHFLKTGKQFVYVRRYSKELKKACFKGKDNPVFFDQIKKDEEMKNIKLDNTKDTALVNEKIAGFFITLSTSLIEKSASFENVDTIIFDEAFITKGTYRYLPNEVQAFLDLVESIGRLRKLKIIMISNASSETNPYFLEFNLSLPYNSEFKTFKNGLILVWYSKNEKYREVKKQTEFGRLVEGTKYGKYAIDNEFYNDSKSFIKKKTKNAKYKFTICMVHHNYGVYIDARASEMFVSNKVDEKHPLKVTLNYEAHAENNLYIRKRGNLLFKLLTNFYYDSKLFFENQNIKNEVLGDLLRYLH